MHKLITGKFSCNPEKAYIAVAPSPVAADRLNAYVLIVTADGWRFVREQGRAFGCPVPSAEDAIKQAISIGAMVFEAESLFDVLTPQIKKIV